MKKVATILAAAILASNGVYAANPAEEEDLEEFSEAYLEEIIITAQRTQKSQQDVPVAMAVMDAEALRREQIRDTQDLQGRVPSLSIGANAQMRNTQSPTIRGQGTTYGASPGVVIYYAEVPLPADFPGSAQGGAGKFFDAANLQILKGAQGTLFGRNTTGGALLIEPRQPHDTFTLSVAAETTNYSGRKAEAIINVPLIDDTLYVRAGVQKFKRDGFTKDITSGKRLDNQDYWTARLGITWMPTDNIENYLLSWYSDSDDNGTSLIIEGFNGDGLNEGLSSIIPGNPDIGCQSLNAQAGSTNCGADIVAAQQARGIRKTELSLTPYDKIKTGGVIDQLNIEITDSFRVRNILSYSLFEHNFNWDADGSRAWMQDLETSVSQGYKAYDISQLTEEFQVQGTALDDYLEYVAGFYYQHNKPESAMGQNIYALFFPLPTAPYSLEQKSYAPYVQGTYEFKSVQGLKLTVGMRYTTDKIEGESTSGGGFHDAKLRKEAFTYTTGVDYLTENNLFYAKISRGYKAGGFSATAVSPELFTFEPEYVTNYEIGQKSDFSIRGIPARLNTALYYSDYDDMQRGGIDRGTGFNLGSAIYTAGSASIMGFELDMMAEPLEGLRVSFNYAYTDSQYEDFSIKVNGLTPQLDCSGQYIPQGGYARLDCAPFQYTPEHQASVSANYDLPLPAEIGLINASLTYAWTDDQYSSSYSLPEVEPGAWIDAFGLLNATISWYNIYGSDFDLSIFGTNLTDKEYRISNSNVWNLNYFRASIYGEPRIVGARLSYNFE